MISQPTTKGQPAHEKDVWLPVGSHWFGRFQESKWLFPKIGVPQNGWFILWMIWGYHHLRKPPNNHPAFSLKQQDSSFQRGSPSALRDLPWNSQWVYPSKKAEARKENASSIPPTDFQGRFLLVSGMLTFSIVGGGFDKKKSPITHLPTKIMVYHG